MPAPADPRPEPVGPVEPVELVRPTTDLAASWWAMVDAFAGEEIHGSGLRPGEGDTLRDPHRFGLWVEWLVDQEGPHGWSPGRVPSSYRWIVLGERVVGTIAVRHALNEGLVVRGGHVGYAVEPGSRRRGVASSALRSALGIAARRGLGAVLVTCEVGNLASARTIVGAGGRPAGIRDGSARYWVPTRGPRVTQDGTVGGA